MKIVEYRKLWFLISIIIFIIGGIFLGINGLNFGIDFVGGTIINIDLHQTFEVSEIREITDQFDNNADITYSGEDRQQVMIQTQESLTDEQRREIFSAFQEEYNLADEDLLSIDQVDPIIGDELKNQTLLAVSIAVIAMLIYITFRFEISFAISAIVALTHDMLIVICFYSIMGIQVNAPFIAAILTILGYSINDSIVIFDRIRENRKKFKKHEALKLVNTSISQSLARSISTSLTTLITITALYILGVEAVKSFALPLIVGFIAGTYSSIFIANPIWYLVITRKQKNPRAV